MSKKISIAIDAMGGDNAPDKTIEGIKIFLDKNKSKNDFTLNIFGQQDILDQKIKKYNLNLNLINVINTNNLNPQISSFFFCILLFYLFFEVFFSFFRKLYLKKSPLKPDRSHLHMLTYGFLANSLHFKDTNYLNSLLINVIYTSLILPAVFFLDNGLICKYWFFSLLILYIVFYSLLYSFAKKQ